MQDHDAIITVTNLKGVLWSELPVISHEKNFKKVCNNDQLSQTSIPCVSPAHSLPLLHDPSTRYPLPPSFVGHHFRSPSLLRERPRGSSTLPSLASRPSRTRSLAPASLSRTPPAITIITVIINPFVACPAFLQLVIDSAPRHLTAGALTFDLRPLRLKWLRITLATIARQLCERSPDSLRCGPR